MSSDSPIVLSSRLSDLSVAARLADGSEVKLDWDHAADLSGDHTLTDVCAVQGVDPATVRSVHLPPGTNRRHGMAVASGNTGLMVDFVHETFGPALAPSWLTAHSARAFDYRQHLELLGTLTDITGHRFALENTPDSSHFHTPEDLLAVGLLAAHVDSIDSPPLLVDTAHVPMDRRTPTPNRDAVDAVLDRMDELLRVRFEPAFREALQRGATELDLPDGDPWRLVLSALHLLGGDRIRALHLDNPVTDGLPDVDHPDSGQSVVLEFFLDHDLAVVLEPGAATAAEIDEVVKWLRGQR